MRIYQSVEWFKTYNEHVFILQINNKYRRFSPYDSKYYSFSDALRFLKMESGAPTTSFLNEMHEEIPITELLKLVLDIEDHDT